MALLIWLQDTRATPMDVPLLDVPTKDGGALVDVDAIAIVQFTDGPNRSGTGNYVGFLLRIFETQL